MTIKKMVLVSEDQYLLDFLGGELRKRHANVLRPADWTDAFQALRGEDYQIMLLDESRLLAKKEAPLRWLRSLYHAPLVVECEPDLCESFAEQLAGQVLFQA